MKDIVDAARNEQRRRTGAPSDAVEFLRGYAEMYEDAGQPETGRRLREAADELERLRMR